MGKLYSDREKRKERERVREIERQRCVGEGVDEGGKVCVCVGVLVCVHTVRKTCA